MSIGTTSTAYKYLGADIPCVGILTNDSIEVAFQKLSEYVCSLEVQTEKNIPILYSATALPAITTDNTSPYVLPTPFVITGTTYTVPTSGEGDYELLYTTEYLSLVAGGIVAIKVFKNGVEYSPIVSKTVETSGTAVLPFTVFASNIYLVAGDTIQLRGSSTKGATIQNSVFKLTKLN